MAGGAKSDGGRPKKKAKVAKGKAKPAPTEAELAAAASIKIGEQWFQQKAKTELKESFASGKPYPYCVIRPFLGPEGFAAAREALQSIPSDEKETDLFRFFQTPELAPLGRRSGTGRMTGSSSQGHNPAVEKHATPALHKLLGVFTSTEFRELCQEVTQCGELCDRVDMAAQVYPRGSHLLCHDDVIGTRKVSFVYYLTDPSEEWKSEEGGALELYPQQPGAPPGTPAAAPSAEVLPAADSLALFLVEPGVSFHAVREVRGERARVSLQGWLHAPSLELTNRFQDRSLATLTQLTAATTSSPEAAAATPEAPPAVQTADKAKAADDEEVELSAADAESLAAWIAPEYLDNKQLKAISEKFADGSYAVLTSFLRTDKSSALAAALADADRADGFGSDGVEPPVPPYQAGVADGWELLGPPHLRRLLRHKGAATIEAPAGSSVHKVLGARLAAAANGLFKSAAFRRWLHCCTGMETRDEGEVEIRRFRPGMDYTVAARATAPPKDRAELDATLVFVQDGKEEAAAAWEGEEVGGFESYIAEEDDGTVEAQEIYKRDAEDGPLVNLPAKSNTLCLVMRDSQTLRFVKFLSRDAPSSRVDVSAFYGVDAPDDSSDEAEDAAAASGEAA
eukprot:TRINITY_DN63909_c0_g1_i1.p1 TRINITY_DN63909_c0_g1~~TRINITY_DN63909_c0_g1_i1.p1  ORF type:complete len:653 (+),score=174.91 TRINITY_DN63909_c0_g1_i1:88-1959(+)